MRIPIAAKLPDKPGFVTLYILLYWPINHHFIMFPYDMLKY